MALVMLALMLGMYTDRGGNVAIFIGAGFVVVVAGVFFLRSQATVEDVVWMKAMIPHHSIAILTSARAELSDPRVKALADAIIETQRDEIAQMKLYIEELETGADAPPGTERADVSAGP